jgi:hypothetical protein
LYSTEIIEILYLEPLGHEAGQSSSRSGENQAVESKRVK